MTPILHQLIVALLWKLLRCFVRIRIPFRLEDFACVRHSFSQFGEDLLIYEHLCRVPLTERGIYVDAGCFDPYQYSNTRLLMLHGWNGINIDADPEVIEKFKKHRPHDVNINACLSDDERELHFAQYGGKATARIVEQLRNKNRLPIKKTMRRVTTTTLSEIFSGLPAFGSRIDLLDIDCEGHDLNVLKGLNIELFRPRIISIESHGFADREQQHAFLVKKDYNLIERRGMSSIYRDSTW
jgi:FkbM family methyltransferase